MIVYSCIIFLFCNPFLSAQEQQQDAVQQSDTHGSTVMYIVKGISVSNIDKIKGVNEIRYIEKEKAKSYKPKKSLTKRKRANKKELSPTEVKEENKRETKVYTFISRVPEKSKLHSLVKTIAAAISTTNKPITKYRYLIKENQHYTSLVITSFTGVKYIFDREFFLNNIEFSTPANGIRPPPFS